MRVINKKSLTVAILLSLVATYGFAADYTSSTSVSTLPTDSGSSVSNGATLTVTGDSTIDFKGNGELVGFNAQGGSLEAKDLTINVAPADGTTGVIPKGLIVRGDSTSTISGDLNVNTVLASSNTTGAISPDSNASYAVAVGYDYNGGGAEENANLTVQNANLTVTNTADTVIATAEKTKTKGQGFFKTTGTVTFNFGQQLSALKVFRSTGAIPTYTSNGTFVAKVFDSSTAKIGDYLVGEYVSGDGSKAIFNGLTEINVVANGKNSAGIKIGKSDDSATPTIGSSVTVTQSGMLSVDTTKTLNSASVRLFGVKSAFSIESKELSKISSGQTAIEFGVKDYETTGSLITTGLGSILYPSVPKETEVRASNGLDQSVYLKNTELTTVSDSASLIKVEAADIRSDIVDDATSLGFYTYGFVSGKYTNKNAAFTLTGQLSSATAATSGWAIEVVGVDDGTDDLVSSLTANITDGAVLTGQVYKAGESTLNLNIKNATWNLPQATINVVDDDPQVNTSTLNNLTLTDGALLNAVDKTATFKSDQTIILTNPDYTAYTGLFTNSDSIINLANQVYGDTLTIDGNYVATGAAQLYVNTLWNSPGTNDYSPTISTSDELHITGTATGTTTVYSYGKDGKVDVVDGTIGSIKADLGTNSAVVVKVDTPNTDNNFIGTAKTSGAGELQLAKATVDGSDVYFWTVTALNPDKDVIIDPSASGYVQMPKVGELLLGQTVGTYHERRGDNQIVGWDRSQLPDQDHQIWARYINSRTDVDGYNRFDFKLKTNGIQIGDDFAVHYAKDGGYSLTGAYFAYLKGDITFKDEKRAENGIISSDTYTGSGDSDVYSVGLTKTFYEKDGSYLDLVGQLSYLNNEYNARNGLNAKNHGWGTVLSAEVGRPYVVQQGPRSHWVVEPQAQLIYTYQGLSSMNDGVHDVDQDNTNSLVGRLGVRVANHQLGDADASNSKTFYGVANVWQRFGNASNTTRIGGDEISEKYGKTFGEIGLGAQVPIKKNVYLYGDVRYMFNLSGSGDYSGYRGSIGAKFTW